MVTSRVARRGCGQRARGVPRHRGRAQRWARRLLPVGMIVVGTSGCTTYKPPFLICDCVTLDRPIRIFVMPEEDLVGQYAERLSFFGLDPLGARINAALGESEVMVLSKPTYHSSPVPRRRANPFQVVADSLSADLVVAVGVDHFAYESASSVRERVLDYHFLGFLGVLGRDDGPRGIVGAACRATPTAAAARLRGGSFDIVGLSPAGMPKEQAFEAAMDEAAKVFIYQLLRTDDSASALPTWSMRTRVGEEVAPREMMDDAGEGQAGSERAELVRQALSRVVA